MHRSRRAVMKSLMLAAAAAAVSQVPALASGSASPLKSEAAELRPDIVLFIADDMTRADIGAYGSVDARTPNIDQLAKDGTQFVNAFATSPSCTPSRSSIFTGDYPIKHGAHANHSIIRPGIETLPSYLQALGYRVVIAGKTHVGPRNQFPFEYFPASVTRPAKGQGVLRSNLDLAAIDGLLSDRDKKKPLALIVASFASHTPWLRNDGYDAAALAVPPQLLDTPETREARARYMTRVTQADKELAAVRASIAKHGDPQNTLLMFTADQGSQFPFGKWNLYDAGIATPLIAVWPGHVPAARKTEAMVSLADLLPTMQQVAGGKPSTAVDGRSFFQVLTGQADRFHDEIYAAHSGIPEKSLEDNYAPMRAVRTPDYKLIVNFRPDIRFESAVSKGKGPDSAYWDSWVERAKTDPKAAAVVEHYHHRVPVELYDLRADPYELKNLASDPSQQGRIAEMRGKLDAWMVQQGESPEKVTMPEEATRGNFPYAQ